MVQKIHSGMNSNSSANTHHDITFFKVDGMG